MPRSAPFASASLIVCLARSGPHRDRHHFAAVLFLQAQRFFERVAIRLVRLKADVGLANPRPAFDNGQGRVLRGNLFDANSDFQQPPCAIKILNCGRGSSGRKT